MFTYSTFFTSLVMDRVFPNSKNLIFLFQSKALNFKVPKNLEIRYPKNLSPTQYWDSASLSISGITESFTIRKY